MNTPLIADIEDYILQCGYKKEKSGGSALHYTDGNHSIEFDLLSDTLTVSIWSDGDDDRAGYWFTPFISSGICYLSFENIALLLHAYGAISFRRVKKFIDLQKKAA